MVMTHLLDSVVLCDIGSLSFSSLNHKEELALLAGDNQEDKRFCGVFSLFAVKLFPVSLQLFFFFHNVLQNVIYGCVSNIPTIM